MNSSLKDFWSSLSFAKIEFNKQAILLWQKKKMSSNMKAQFLQAEAKMQANPTELAPVKKMRLYGLVKQVKEGDCKMPMPPA